MTTAKPYNDIEWGIKMNDGTWMKCINGQDWYSSKKAALRILPEATAFDKTMPLGVTNDQD